MGAGILPVTIYRNKIYFLFSREHMGRSWWDVERDKKYQEPAQLLYLSFNI